MADQTRNVDDLRARLRELGYLDAGVDRFVLGPVRGGRSLFSVAWRSSLRIGLLAGLLLGPSAAIALAVRLPGLVTGVRDVIVLAVYLGALFGVGVACLSLVATLLLGYLASRPRGDAAMQRSGSRLARIAGGIVAVASLVYLVLWWRTVNPAGTVWSSAAWTWPVLAFSTAISMLLGHAVTVSTLAFAARGAQAAWPSLRLPSRSWLLTVGTGAAVFLGGATMLFLTTRGEGRAVVRAPAVPVVRTGVRLTVVAVDGVDVPFLERLIASGRVPRFARLLGGARLTLPASDAPDPARTWTSLATGQRAEIHGVSGIEIRTVSGMAGTMPTPESGLPGAIGAATDMVRLTRPTPTTGLQRRSKTFWEVAADFGLQTSVVNWWATWPAPAGAGIVLSDRATLRLERGGELDAEIAPASLYASLEPEWPSLRDQARRQIMATFEGTEAADAAILRRAAEQDGVSTALAVRVLAESTDLRAIYLSGLDIAQHNLAGGAGGGGLPASALAARVEAIGRYYEFLDRLLAPLVDDPRPGSVVALLADPGRSASRGPGLLVLAGTGVRAGVRQVGNGADVAPTILYLLGVPVSRELPGRPRTDLVDPSFVSRVPVRALDTYGRRTIGPRPPGSAPLDQEMLERLRSLGYVR
ncbi:MAG TPA: alkaline phosphatase family protein [Vicinamibacterales bacterium]